MNGDWILTRVSIELTKDGILSFDRLQCVSFSVEGCDIFSEAPWN